MDVEIHFFVIFCCQFATIYGNLYFVLWLCASGDVSISSCLPEWIAMLRCLCRLKSHLWIRNYCSCHPFSSDQMWTKSCSQSWKISSRDIREPLQIVRKMLHTLCTRCLLIHHQMVSGPGLIELATYNLDMWLNNKLCKKHPLQRLYFILFDELKTSAVFEHISSRGKWAD